MSYNRIVQIQRVNNDNQWIDHFKCHAAINKRNGGEELEAGAMQSQETLQFDVRFCAKIAEIRHNTQLYQVIYNGSSYKIVDYDDFKEQHRNIRLQGVRYNA